MPHRLSETMEQNSSLLGVRAGRMAGRNAKKGRDWKRGQGTEKHRGSDWGLEVGLMRIIWLYREQLSRDPAPVLS